MGIYTQVDARGCVGRATVVDTSIFFAGGYWVGW